jgi:hypothetical protein
VRGGYLERIDYGTRIGTEASGTAPMKVEFTVGDRCLASCWSGTAPVTANWPDTPWDLQCGAAPCNNNPAPSFWSTKRLTKVKTSVRSGTTYAPVDEWVITHQFPATGETTVSPALWLSNIVRTGYTGGTLALPKVDFGGTRYANRTDYNTSLAVPMVNRYRITRVSLETGGELQVAYQSSDCTVASQADPDNNSKRCFPQYYQPEGSPAGWSWWNKYRVTSVTERDLVGGSPDVVHTYGYATDNSSTSVLWHHNDAEKWALPLAKRSWSDWRGYSMVTVATGPSTGTRTKTEYRYFRGLHADRTDAGETARTATVTDSQGAVWTDFNPRTGSVLEEISYAADGVTALYKQRNHPWRSPTATRVENENHVQPTTSEAFFNELHRVEVSEFLPDSGTWRVRETNFAFDPTYGQVITETDNGQVGDTSDDVCTTTTYARNTTAAWLIDYPAEQMVTNCAATPRPAH